jgi:hypothetical protein
VLAGWDRLSGVGLKSSEQERNDGNKQWNKADAMQLNFSPTGGSNLSSNTQCRQQISFMTYFAMDITPSDKNLHKKSNLKAKRSNKF